MKKFLILTILSIFIIPICSIIPFRMEGGWYAHYLGILFFGLLAIGFVLWDFDKFLSLFYVYCLFSTFNFFQMMIGLLKITHNLNSISIFVFFKSFINLVARSLLNIEPRALILLINFGIFALISYGISKFPPRYMRCVFRVILAVVLIQLFWIGLQLNNKDPFFYCLKDPLKDSPVGSIGSPNQTGIFFALTLPAMLYIHPLLGILSLIGLSISKASFAFVAAIASGLLYLFFNNKMIFIFILLIMLATVNIFFIFIDPPHRADFDTRFSVWSYAIRSTVEGQVQVDKNGSNVVYKTNPLYGYGFSKFLAIFPYISQQKNKVYFNATDEKFTHTHNDYIELFFELGWIGLTLLLSLIGNFIYSFIRTKKTKETIVLFCGLLSYLICSSGNFLMQMAVPGMFLVVFYGLYKGGLRRNGTIATIG